MSRGRELRALEDLLDGARQGRSGVVVVHGEPGVGKTWLCQRARDRAEGFLVVDVRGTPCESDLPYAGLFDVVAPVAEAVGDLPGGLQDVLDSALGRGSGPCEPLAVGVAT